MKLQNKWGIIRMHGQTTYLGLLISNIQIFYYTIDKHFHFNSLREITSKVSYSYIPVSKIVEKAVCKSVFLTKRHCILSTELTKTHSFRQTFFLAILPIENISTS